MSRSRQIVELSPEADALMRGRANEDRVERALQRLRNRGEIVFYRRSDVEGQLDLEGIDFQVYPEADWCIDLQVKSSEFGKEMHIAEYGHSIACVIVHDAMDDRQLEEEISRVLGLSIERINSRH